MSEHARPLQELRRADAGRFGGKSASLGELIASGIPVPPGFALSSAGFISFLAAAGLGDEIAEQLTGVDHGDVGSLRSASEEIGKRIRGVAFPDALRDELGERYEALAAGRDEPPVAVRSSALGEDSEAATFAGQQETYLWVCGADGVCDAVRDCWVSLYSPEAIAYRSRMGSGGRAAMGVTVQEMVDAEVSGVMFTCNPVNGDPSTIAVNASWGLGLAVVGGEVTPDEFRLNKVTGEVTHRSVGPKQVEYRPDPEGAGTIRVEVSEQRQAEACLDDDQLAALLGLGKRVEEHFGSHQDIEWAIAGGEQPATFVLQSRPVTTAPKREAEPGRRQSAIAMVMGTFGADAKRQEKS
jgi:pyruvate,water dikinase